MCLSPHNLPMPALPTDPHHRPASAEASREVEALEAMLPRLDAPGPPASAGVAPTAVVGAPRPGPEAMASKTHPDADEPPPTP